MKWEDLEIGDVIEYTDEFKNHMNNSSWSEDFKIFKSQTIRDIEIRINYITLKFDMKHVVDIHRKSGKYYFNLFGPVMFKIVKLKDD